MQRADVREKVSQALMGRVCWKEGKTDEEIKIMAKTMAANRNRSKREYISPDGTVYRSMFEFRIAEMLKLFGVDFAYELGLTVGTHHYLPDFTLYGADKVARCLLEVTGSCTPKWADGFISRLKNIRKEYPQLPVVVLTSNTSVHRLLEALALPLVRLYYVGSQHDVKSLKEKTLIIESDHFNFDYSHFLPWHQGKCADFHGHSSTISVAVTGYCNENGMVLDFADMKKAVKEAIDLVDHKIMVPKNTVVSTNEKETVISFESKSRAHELKVPTSEVVLLDSDSTVENLSGYLAAAIIDKMPWNVTSALVQMNEGVGKSAVSHISRSDRELDGAIHLATHFGTFLEVLQFYSNIPIWEDCPSLPPVAEQASFSE